uniref:Arm DNA-binding domain-containing protein n=1 Tax=Sphingobacterium lumbrici TaxID=2559600 RepID=UPI001F48A96C|nr:Arm DNA-binding domain-containing protein [Sphingobacterium lumbrici]
MCRITINGKQSAFSTKLDISASNWDLKYGRVLGKSREAQDTNSKLDKIRSGIEGMLFQNSEERGGCKQC